MTEQLPLPGSLAAHIDLTKRLRVFGFDATVIDAVRAVWEIIGSDAPRIADAYWRQWQVGFADQRDWISEETQAIVDEGIGFLRDRFVNTSDVGWVVLIEQAVALAYVDRVSPMALRSMICASDKVALEVLLRKVDPTDARLPAMIDALMRLSSLEGDITGAIYSLYERYAAATARSRLAADFRDTIATSVQLASNAGAMLREQAGGASVAARGMLGKTGGVAAAADHQRGAHDDELSRRPSLH